MKTSYIFVKDQLKDAYKEAFCEIENYGTMNLVGEDTKEELLMELIDNMLIAQEAGQEVSEIIGDDVEKFCESFYSGYEVSERLFEIPKFIYRFACVLAIFEMLFEIIPSIVDGTFHLGLKSDVGAYLIGVIGGIILDFLVYLIIRPSVRKIKNVKVTNSILLISVVVCMLCVMFVVIIFDINVQLPSVLVVGLAVLYIIGYRVLQAFLNKKKYGTFREPKVEGPTMSDMIKTDMDKSLPVEWLKSYNNKVSRANKKGKTPIAYEAYMEKLEKRYDYKRQNLTNIICFSVGPVLCTVILLFCDGFEGFVDFLIYLAMIAAIEALIYRLFVKISKTSSQTFLAMKRVMAKENITLDEYVEKYCK